MLAAVMSGVEPSGGLGDTGVSGQAVHAAAPAEPTQHPSTGPAYPIGAGSSGSSLLGADRVGEGDPRSALRMPVDVAVVALERLALEVEGVVVLVEEPDP